MSTRHFWAMDLQNEKVIVVKFIGSAKNLANVPVQVHGQHIDKITTERSHVNG
jgi:hypothetical protein